MPVPQSITQELQKVAPSAIIELFELRLVTALHGSNDIYRFHAGVNGKNDGGNVVWAGQTYTAYPVQCDGFEYSGNGQLPRPKLRVANVIGTITAVLLVVNAVTPGNDLIGAKVIRRRTLARYLDAVNFPSNTNPYGTPDPTAEFPEEVYYISRKVTENRDLVEFELSAAFDLQGVRAPKRQCIANVCQWVYRSAECGYTDTRYFDDNDNPVSSAALDVCGKRVSSCKKRFDTTSDFPPNYSTVGKSNTVTSGQTLSAGQDRVSTNGWYRLIMQNDGNLVIYDKGRTAIWSTATTGSNADRAIMQADGNFVLYTAALAVVWSTGTLEPGNTLVMRDDGNLVVLGTANEVRWQSRTSSAAQPVYANDPSPPLPFGSFPGIGSYTL